MSDKGECIRCRDRKIQYVRRRSQCSDCDHSGDESLYQNSSNESNHSKVYDSINATHNFIFSSSDSHIFRKEAEAPQHPNQPSPLLVLCDKSRSHILTTWPACSAPVRDLLQSLCENAGSFENFPLVTNVHHIDLPPKKQALTAIAQFFQHIDGTTDIFIRRNLLANLDRVYAQSTARPGDDVWAICFKVITLLILGVEISAQPSSTIMFGNFARSFPPCCATLVNSSLLATPRLINVQTLILLSVAARRFDPPGWSEIIFSHACRLARSMSLHETPSASTSDESLERAKVIKLLFCRDRSLCTTVVTVPYVPHYTNSLQSSTALKFQEPYSDRLQLAIIQDEILSFSNPRRMSRASLTDTSTAPHSAQTLHLIERQLEQYTQDFGILNHEAAYYKYSHHSMITLEFLATRILALQHGSEPRHGEKIYSDAKASCLLLLVACGAKDLEIIDSFRTATGDSMPSSPIGYNNSPIPNANTTSFNSVLDAFSIRAFFVLLDKYLDTSDDTDTILNLLSKVSTCYTQSTKRMPIKSYHGKIARTFDQLLEIIQLLKAEQQQQESIPPP